MTIVVCRNCQSTEIEYDSTQGNSVCIRCGTVLEENSIVAEVTFAEMADGTSMLQGQFVSAEKGRSNAPTIFGRRTDAGEGREWTLFNAKRRLMALGSALGLSEQHADQAYRWYTLALQHQFTRGRRSGHIAAACLYIVCRMEKTPHMLLDFADVLQTSVYVLGGTFLRLVQLLNLQLPFVDPSFYVGRFASKLDFGERTQTISNTALRIVARMKRDWIQIGRRPAGICAASLLIAARMQGFNRTEREIVRVVHICEATLKKRLEEFGATPSSQLSPEEFESIWLESESDPPSFIRSQKKVLQHQAKVEESFDILTPLSSSDFQSHTEYLTKYPDGKDTLSDLDDDPELECILLSPTESQTKTDIWTRLNQDYLEKEAAKLQALSEQQKHEEQKQLTTGDDETLLKQKKKRVRASRQPTPQQSAHAAGIPVADTAAEAARKVLSTKRFSKKINYAALENLLATSKPT